MNIVFNTYPFAFAPPGGGEVQLLQYRHHLEAAGVSVSLFDLWQGGAQLVDGSVMHFFSCMPGSLPFLSFCARRGMPIVISPNLWITEETMHQYPVEDIRGALTIADAVVCNSDAECEQLSRTFGLRRGKFHTVYNGVETAYFSPVAPDIFRRAFGLNGKFVLNVANIERRKNQLALVRAMKSFPDLRLVVLGHVRDQAYADQCASEGGEQWLHAGSLPHGSELLRSAFAACELFALPSTLETPGLAALEAAACGRPVVVTAEGSTFEYFGQGAIYADPIRVDSIVQAIDAALVSPPPSMQSRVESAFAWRHVIKRLIPVYESVLAQKKEKALYFASRDINGEGFNDPELDDEGCFVWSRRESTLLVKDGLVAWRWWAPSDIEVDICLDGELFREAVRVSTQWAPYALELPPRIDGAKRELGIRVRGDVVVQGERELGVLFRDLSWLDGVSTSAGEREAWCLARGLVLEGAGAAGDGFHPAERDERGWFVWSSSEFSLQLRGTRVEIDGFVARKCRLVIKSCCNGELLFSSELDVGNSGLEFSLPPQGQDAWNRLCCHVEAHDAADQSDPRDLGLAIRRIRVL